MNLIAIILIAIGVSMDTFAVSICKGLGMKTFSWKNSLIIAAFFGGFQALMPLIGWLIGSRLQHLIMAFDHWVAFGLLLFIGGKMIIESLQHQKTEDVRPYVLNMKELFLLAIATSIDALAVGISFALIQPVHLWLSFLLIGVTTFLFSVGGAYIGHRFGNRYQRSAEMLGGLILIG